MTELAESPVAWEPLTPRGVAAFAHARLSRLLLVQLVIAALAAAAMVWFFSDACFPTVRSAIRNLPATGAIRSGRLDWTGDTPQLLAEGRILAFVVDPNYSGQIQSSADIQLKFGRETYRVGSLLGYTEWSYSPDWIVAFNRTDLEPLWGAWEPEWLAITSLAVFAGLMWLWALLATVYCLPAWLIGLFANRDLNFRASWKLSGAALMPGAMLLTIAIVLYGFGALNLIQFGFFFGAHLALAWLYLFLSQLFLPRITAALPRGNPFNAPPIH